MFQAIFTRIANAFRAPAIAPYVRPAPRKHIRVAYRTFDVSVAYYGENGRKLTTRRYATKDIVRIKNMARAAGYQAF